MNLRKDIYERVKYIMKEQSEMKVNCSELARRLNCDRRTIRRYVELAKNGEKPSKRVYQKKTDGFEHIIEEKVKTTAPAIAIYHYLVKEHGYTGSYSTLKRYIHNLNTERQKDTVIRFETNPGIQAQVDWKESLKFKTKDGETIKFNVFLIILGFSRTKFLMVTETRDLQQVEFSLACAFKYFGGVPREILFDNMRSIIDKARTQYSEPVFNENFKVFAEDCGFVPKACVAYRPETKGKVEVTAKLMNRLKVYSGDITCFDDIRRIAADLNYEINSSICQATGKKPFDLLELEKPFLIQTNLDILTGYFVDTVKRKVSAESMISYEGKKYSVPPEYIGKKVDISDTGTINKNQVMDFMSLRFIESKSNIIFIGSSGVGKTHLATAIGIEAASKRISTYFINFAVLMEKFKQAAKENRVEKVVKHYLKYTVLIIDEIGYLPVDKDAAFGFFQLIAARYEFRPTILTTNQPFSKWPDVFGDAVIANAIIDRLVHHCDIVKITGHSYRIKDRNIFDDSDD